MMMVVSMLIMTTLQYSLLRHFEHNHLLNQNISLGQNTYAMHFVNRTPSDTAKFTTIRGTIIMVALPSEGR